MLLVIPYNCSSLTFLLEHKNEQCDKNVEIGSVDQALMQVYLSIILLVSMIGNIRDNSLQKLREGFIEHKLFQVSI